MAQPQFVPIAQRATVRPSMRLKSAESWTKDRPAEQADGAQQLGRGFGRPGPDQGFALKLAKRFSEDFVLSEHEDAHDVIVGLAVLASKRASAFGRAPSVYDIQVAMNIFSFLEPAEPDLVTLRSALFGGLSHGYAHQQHLADAVPDAVLAMSPEASAANDQLWRELLN